MLAHLCRKRNLYWIPLRNGILQFHRLSQWELGSLEASMLVYDCSDENLNFSTSHCKVKSVSDSYFSYYDNTTIMFKCSHENTFEEAKRNKNFYGVLFYFSFFFTIF